MKRIDITREIKISLVAILIISLTIGIFVYFFATAQEDLSRNELLAEYSQINDDNPEYKKYFVTDENISKVRPGTLAIEFIDGFKSQGEEIEIYEDRNCTKKITERISYIRNVW